MTLITAIGLLAGTLTTLAFIPQVIKTWKSKSAEDVSLEMFVIFCLGVFLWLIYGFLLQDIPIMIANLVTLILASTILGFKLKYG
ncbi:MAG: SemiSWEET transporter [Oscillatoriales cyanobacterium RM1_1_9]|nr:SemiSWEET transporter [Oscillatoriales cyanobacterium SM2_3_0]NJO44948.1 SemiSWEET transporter [Oscillatoriales cyanobacterium RM2_1_1]NJO71549.1 SemiSWEET transporter [Oscillatoriales cyanobacterium RM1_1_9]